MSRDQMSGDYQSIPSSFHKPSNSSVADHDEEVSYTDSNVTNFVPTRVTSGIRCNRCISIVIIILVGCISYYFDISMTLMSKELASKEKEITELQKIVEKQAPVIARFNHTVANHDVLVAVAALKSELEASEADMMKNLSHTEADIFTRLDVTEDKLDRNITEAETIIHKEVAAVTELIGNYMKNTTTQFAAENNIMVYQIAGTFTLLGGLISMWHITDHLRNFNAPFVQRKVLAILMMSPIYGFTSWLSLVFLNAEGYCAIIKDFYEAYCIYTFLSFIIAVLGRGNREVVVQKLARHADHLSPPFHLFGWCYPQKFESNYALAEAVLLQCQFWAMQFVFFRPLLSITNFVLKHFDRFSGKEGSLPWYLNPFTYTAIGLNLTMFIAFTGLLKIYHAVQFDLAMYKPLPKFLCIKGVVFMTFWQGLAIAILAEQSKASGQDDENVEEWASRTQSFVICLEMFVFSIFHFYCFPTYEWKPDYRPKLKSNVSSSDMIALKDFMSDLKLLMSSGKKKKKKKRKKKIRFADAAKSVSIVNDVRYSASPGVTDNLLDDIEKGGEAVGKDNVSSVVDLLGVNTDNGKLDEKNIDNAENAKEISSEDLVNESLLDGTINDECVESLGSEKTKEVTSEDIVSEFLPDRIQTSKSDVSKKESPKEDSKSNSSKNTKNEDADDNDDDSSDDDDDSDDDSDDSDDDDDDDDDDNDNDEEEKNLKAQRREARQRLLANPIFTTSIRHLDSGVSDIEKDEDNTDSNHSTSKESTEKPNESSSLLKSPATSPGISSSKSPTKSSSKSPGSQETKKKFRGPRPRLLRKKLSR